VLPVPQHHAPRFEFEVCSSGAECAKGHPSLDERHEHMELFTKKKEKRKDQNVNHNIAKKREEERNRS
jgi:hypothetical protein